MQHDPHVDRLVQEQGKLINLNKRSRLIRIEPVDQVPGLPPDRYLITFTCKGIAAIDEELRPIESSFHQVTMYISREFPRAEPHLKWLTPIWHPNIEHKEPHHVCTNKNKSFHPAKGLDSLVEELGEMVQYKRYHAAWVPPWPADREVADWVVNYAEPRGIVGPNKPFDDQPLKRQYRIRPGSRRAKPTIANVPERKARRSPAGEGIQLGTKLPRSGRSDAASSPRRGIELGAQRRS